MCVIYSALEQCVGSLLVCFVTQVNLAFCFINVNPNQTSRRLKHGGSRLENSNENKIQY